MFVLDDNYLTFRAQKLGPKKGVLNSGTVFIADFNFIRFWTPRHQQTCSADDRSYSGWLFIIST